MDIVPFAKWAGQPLPTLPSIPLPSGELWLHNGAAGVSSLATLRAYLNHHVRNNGWLTIGYSFAIADGGVYECRGPGRQGAHTYGRNHASHGIVVCGDYTSTDPSPADLDALVWLLRHGHQKRWWRRPQITGGHRDAPGASTTCPGLRLQDAIPDINRRARTIPDQGDIMTDNDRKLLQSVDRKLDTVLSRLDTVDDHARRLRRSVRYDAQRHGYPVADSLAEVGEVDA